MIPNVRSPIASAAVVGICLAAAAAAAEPATGWRGFDKTGPLSTRRFTPAGDAKPLVMKTAPRPAPPLHDMVGVDTPAEPGAPAATAGDSPTESSGSFDTPRPDLGDDSDIAAPRRGQPRRGRLDPRDPSPADRLPDPLVGTEQISPDATGPDAESIIARLLPPRSDSWSDWSSGLEPLHACGEPRALAPCVPPPPCHPADPPRPLDLVGVEGVPSCGPIYGGPCAPRTGSHDGGRFAWLHRPWDRFVDCFYRAK